MLNLITAIIKPHMLEAVKDAVKAAGVTGITITEVQGFGRQGGHSETYRGAEYEVDFIPKVKLEILLGFDEVDRVTKVIREAAALGEVGDGKIWVTSVDRAIRIRTGEMGTDAI